MNALLAAKFVLVAVFWVRHPVGQFGLILLAVAALWLPANPRRWPQIVRRWRVAPMACSRCERIGPVDDWGECADCATRQVRDPLDDLHRAYFRRPVGVPERRVTREERR